MNPVRGRCAGSCPGATLLELLAAVAVFSIVAAAGYAALGQGLDIQEKLREQKRFQLRLESVFNRVRADLELAVNRAPRTLTGAGAAFTGRVNAGDYTDLLEFTRRSYTGFHDGPASPFTRVGYRLRADGLYRRAWPRLDLPYHDMEAAADALLLEGVQELRLRYLAPFGEWFESWPPPAGDAKSWGLPGAVEVMVTLDDQEFYRWLFHVGPPR